MEQYRIQATSGAELVGTVEAAVAAGELAPGERLPSVRRLAAEVGLSPGTIAASFAELRRRGIVVSEPRRGVRVDGLGMRPAELRAALQRGVRGVIITPRGQNPTGAALDAARARELRAVLSDFPQALAIEDDHLGLLGGRRVHSTLGRSERWAATRSVAKGLGPDLRLAILAGDALTVARVQGRLQCGPGWVSHILQHAVLRLWRDPAVAALITRASRAYDQRRGRLLRDLAARGVAATGASGLNVWIGVDEETAAVAGLLQRGR